MKKCITQRLYWKKWPYKIILGDATEGNNDRWQKYQGNFVKTRKETPEWKTKLRRWFKKNFPNGGIRQESRVSVFLHTQDEVDFFLDTWKHMVLELWAPESEGALTLMQDHVHDIIRATPWYKKFPLRARILYTQEFKNNGVKVLRDTVEQFDKDNWHSGGLLNTLLTQDGVARLPWPCGQPFYLYLADNDDAVMLKLQAGDWVERFERQRKP